MKNMPDTSSRWGVTRSVTSPSPARATVRGTSRSPAIRISVCMAAHVETACPSTAVMRSPARSPALSAGPSGMTPPTKDESSPNFAEGQSERMTARTKARTMFMKGPATATRSSFHAGIRARGWGASFVEPPSNAFVPSGSTSGMET